MLTGLNPLSGVASRKVKNSRFKAGNAPRHSAHPPAAGIESETGQKTGNPQQGADRNNASTATRSPHRCRASVASG